MQFTLGMPFLGILGKFYRNRKGLTTASSQSLTYIVTNSQSKLCRMVPNKYYLKIVIGIDFRKQLLQ